MFNMILTIAQSKNVRMMNASISCTQLMKDWKRRKIVKSKKKKKKKTNKKKQKKKQKKNQQPTNKQTNKLKVETAKKTK